MRGTATLQRLTACGRQVMSRFTAGCRRLSGSKPGRRQLRLGLVILTVVALVAVLVPVIAYRTLFAAVGGEAVVLSVPSGASTRAVANLLAEANVIRSPLALRAWIRLRGLDGQLRAGEYRFDPAHDAFAVLDRLIRGKVVEYPFTIPEGLTVAQIAVLLEQKGFAAAQKFREAARQTYNYSFLPANKDLREPLEGYLYPDTYRYVKGMTERQLVDMMLRRMAEALRPLEAPAAAQGFTLHQLVTLASIVEKETAVADELPLVASVFRNRLRIDMKLDSCATLNYLLDKPRPVITMQDLEIVSPYNTYKHNGLPPGPIGSPGLAALKAALEPAETKYFYFVSRNDGTHAFSVTFEEHNRWKLVYQSPNP
ncbi:MAG: endolytic transglycosylase MltG [Bacillota bacterium]